MVLIKWLLFLVMIARTKGYLSWESKNSSVSEKILKTILDSCYENRNSTNPVFIFGDFDTYIDGVSIIRMNNFLYSKDYRVHRSLKFKASSIVLMEEPPEELLLKLKLLRRKKLWNNLVPFFIIGKNTATCESSRSILRTMQKMEVLNPVYICAKSINNTSEIYTLNIITNYAPYPWERIEELEDLHVFRQNFDANISCTHLTYDKTKVLNGYDVVIVDWKAEEMGAMPGMNYFEELVKSSKDVDFSALATSIVALNASGQIEFGRGKPSMLKRYVRSTADITLQTFTISMFEDSSSLFPHGRSEMVAVVKLKAEISTLEKIRCLWSPPVLIAAAIALAIFFLILMIKSWSFGSALLDITRLMTYTSIQFNHSYQSFRIYYTTMLIFMVISNGVFQGKIAAFLTTREKSSAAKSIHELIQLGYRMYTHREIASWAKKGCTRCEFEEVSTFDECIELVLNSTKNVCLIDKLLYESKYILLSLDRVKEPLYPTFTMFKCREHWPLRDRFNGMMMRLVESGLIDFWEMELNSTPKTKRRRIEAEWISEQYRPVKLIKLAFAFELLAAGLSFAVIVFFLELCLY